MLHTSKFLLCLPTKKQNNADKPLIWIASLLTIRYLSNDMSLRILKYDSHCQLNIKEYCLYFFNKLRF